MYILNILLVLSTAITSLYSTEITPSSGSNPPTSSHILSPFDENFLKELTWDEYREEVPGIPTVTPPLIKSDKCKWKTELFQADLTQVLAPDRQNFNRTISTISLVLKTSKVLDTPTPFTLQEIILFPIDLSYRKARILVKILANSEIYPKFEEYFKREDIGKTSYSATTGSGMISIMSNDIDLNDYNKNLTFEKFLCCFYGSKNYLPKDCLKLIKETFIEFAKISQGVSRFNRTIARGVTHLPPEESRIATQLATVDKMFKFINSLSFISKEVGAYVRENELTMNKILEQYMPFLYYSVDCFTNSSPKSYETMQELSDEVWNHIITKTSISSGLNNTDRMSSFFKALIIQTIQYFHYKKNRGCYTALSPDQKHIVYSFFKTMLERKIKLDFLENVTVEDSNFKVKKLILRDLLQIITLADSNEKKKLPIELLSEEAQAFYLGITKDIPPSVRFVLNEFGLHIDKIEAYMKLYTAEQAETNKKNAESLKENLALKQENARLKEETDAASRRTNDLSQTSLQGDSFEEEPERENKKEKYKSLKFTHQMLLWPFP